MSTWYVFSRDAWSGAYTTTEVENKLNSGTFDSADFVVAAPCTAAPQRFSEHMDWRRFYAERPTLDSLKAYMSGKPRSVTSESKGAREEKSFTMSKYGKVSHVWFVQYDGSEFGPLRVDELTLVLKSGKIKGKIYGWRKGMPNWLPISDISELSEVLAQIGYKDPKSIDQRRKAQRMPFLASIRISAVPAMHPYLIGVCLDLSAGGIKILCDHDPGGAGSRLYLRVMPAGKSEVPVFDVEVEIVRVLQEPKGFAVRFVNLAPAVIEAIEKCAAKQEKN